MRQTTVAQLYEDNRERLRLTFVAGNLDATLSVSEERIWPADLVGHLNLIHPTRMQIVGEAELTWARRQPQSKIARYLDGILLTKPPAIIIADGCEIPPIIRKICERSDIALLSTPHPAASVIDHLRLYLSRRLAETTTMHGVFMDVLSLGTLITGESGTGKSELALELITRGHGLVADDAVEFSRVAPSVLEGASPPMLRNFMEVRGLGILNIRTIFGETACRHKMRLRLVCQLDRRQPGQDDPLRLPVQQEFQEILGVRIPKVVLPVAAGRNLAVLIEAAARATILRLRGIDTTKEFIDRQGNLLS